jgi:hypothetical protein
MKVKNKLGMSLVMKICGIWSLSSALLLAKNDYKLAILLLGGSKCEFVLQQDSDGRVVRTAFLSVTRHSKHYIT